MTEGTPLRPWRLVVCVALPMVALSTKTQAQVVTRAELVQSGEDALFNFETDRARDFFVRAVNPVDQPPDSIWAVGVQYLVQMHLELGNSELADTWMRWAVRHEPDMRVDERAFQPEVVRRYRAAVALVGDGTLGDRFTETTWVWPPLGDRETSGTLRIAPSALEVPISVDVSGRGVVQSGRDMTLPPGTYSVRVSAEGYNPIGVTREILPGVTSVLSFSLEPIIVAPEIITRPAVLSDSVDAAARTLLARFSVTRFGTEPTCGTGFLAGRDGLLLTTYAAIRGAESLEVELADGSNIREGIRVAAWDTENNVAVLKLPVSSADSLELTAQVSDSQWIWAFAHPGCRTASVEQLRVASWPDRPRGLLQLSDSLEGGDQGGPLIAQTGGVIGLSLGHLAAVPADHVTGAMEIARRNVSDDRLAPLAMVAERENHLYGSVLIRSTFSDATAHVTPLEAWHWPETERSGPIPLTFSGPLGRYRLDLSAVGQEAHQAEFTIDPGVFKEITEPQIIAAEVGGGGFPWPIALIGAAGAAAGGVFLLLSGGEEPEQPPARGWITITFPQHP